MINGVHTLNVLVEVAEERHRQDETWGRQDFPFHHQVDLGGHLLVGVPYERWAQSFKDACDARRDLAKRGGEDWRSGLLVLLEEVAEAAAERDPARIREELVQVAAVAVKLIEAEDRREAERHGPGCELGMWHGGDCGPSAVLDLTRRMSVAPVPETFRPAGFGDITRETVEQALTDGVYSTGVFEESDPVPPLKAVPLADAVSRLGIDLTGDQKRVLDSLPDATLELKLEALPTHVMDPYDAVGGDMEALEKARNALGRAPVCGREAATSRPCSYHWPEFSTAMADVLSRTPAVVSARHAYNGADRFHGICRCSEGRDHWSHRCPDCEHGFHTAPCRELTGSGAPGDVDECGCRS